MYVDLNKVERIKDAIESIHGAGINYDYNYEVGHTRRYGIVVKATNVYDVMTDTVRFAVKIPVDKPEIFKVLLPASWNDFYGSLLKDYLEEVYEEVLAKV